MKIFDRNKTGSEGTPAGFFVRKQRVKTRSLFTILATATGRCNKPQAT